MDAVIYPSLPFPAPALPTLASVSDAVQAGLAAGLSWAGFVWIGIFLFAAGWLIIELGRSFVAVMVGCVRRAMLNWNIGVPWSEEVAFERYWRARQCASWKRVSIGGLRSSECPADWGNYHKDDARNAWMARAKVSNKVAQRSEDVGL